VSSTGVSFSPDDLKVSLNVEFKLHIRLRVVGEDELGYLLGCFREVLAAGRPVFDVKMLFTIHLNRFIQLQSRCNGNGREIESDVSQSSLFRQIISGDVTSLNLFLGEVGRGEDDRVELAHAHGRIEGDGELLVRSRSYSGVFRLYGEARVQAFLRLQSLEIKFKRVFTFIKALVLSDSNLEGIHTLLVEVLLVEQHPVDG